MTAPVRILHIEDDPIDSEMIQAILKRDGLDCLTRRIETREELLAAIGQCGFDIILSDFKLPTFDGFAALTICLAECPHTPVIIISGTLGEEAAIEAFNRGATDYVLKSRLDRLAPSMRRALREEAERVERLRAEAELKIAHLRLRSHIENTPLAVIEFDSRMQVQYWSPQAEKIFGWRAEEVVGKHPNDFSFAYEEDQEMVGQLIGRLLAGQNSREAAVNRNNTRGGAVIWCEWYSSVLLDEAGEVISILSLVQDITERKRTEEERARLLESEQAARENAESANRAKDEFLAAVSHELRTPLTPVLGWLRLMRTGVLTPDAQAGALEKIERNVRAQVRLVEDLLDVSRIITGKLRLDIRPVELIPIIESAVDSMRPAAEAREIHLVQQLDQHPGLIAGDQDRLRQIVWNLLANAIKFTPPGGSVDVRLARVESHVEISVSDTGQGIGADFLPYVFERFRQADSSITRAHGGLGLGLAIVRHLVEMHGGSIQAESAGPGQGATFTVRLPVVVSRYGQQPQDRRRTAAVSSARLTSEIRLDGLQVLAVDDDPDTLDILSWVLERSGAEVRTAASADEALAIFRNSQPDALVSDIGMPERNGYDLIADIREIEKTRTRSIPAIALTAFTRIDDRLQALAAGFQMHVPKPVEPAELLAVIASLTGRLGKG